MVLYHLKHVAWHLMDITWLARAALPGIALVHMQSCLEFYHFDAYYLAGPIPLLGILSLDAVLYRWMQSDAYAADA